MGTNLETLVASSARQGRTAWHDRGQLQWLRRRRIGIAYVGWVNRGNLGDEAMYQLHKHLSRRSMLPVPLDRVTTRIVTSTHPRVDTMLIGGGTLLGRDGWGVKLAGLRTRIAADRFVVLGAGMEDPSFGESTGVSSADGLARWAALLGEADFVGVRGPRSRKHLEDIGIDSLVIGDPALCIPVKRERIGGTVGSDNAPIVAFNVASVSDGYAKRDRSHYVGLASLLRRLSKGGAVVEAFGMEPGDRKLAREMFPQYAKGCASEVRSLPALVDLLSRSSLVISERLHGAILSANLATSFLLLGYKPKCYDFAESIGYSESVLPLEDLGSDDVYRSAVMQLEADGLPREVQANIEGLRRIFHLQYGTAMTHD